jgi:hypothetical protein
MLVFSPLASAVERVPEREQRLPGVELAQGITELTGVAISPLLGVTAVGAWRYYQASSEQRAMLPWFCHPMFWATSLGLLGVCFLKDLFGTAAPPLLKKPLDVLELFENKLSALVACAGFIPFLFSQLGPQGWGAPGALLETSGPPLACLTFLGASWLDLRLLLLPLAIVWFTTVWLACHAINVLIVLCPFGFVDALLKLFKTFLLGTVVGSSFISPLLGAGVSLAILLVALLVAPWAFRLTAFGTIFGLDVLFPARGRRKVKPAEPHAFLARPMAGAPVRTYGRLARSADGAITFTYRPWLVLPSRSITVPAQDAALAKGLLFPSIVHRAPERDREFLTVMLLPRYRSHEEAISTHFAISEIRETPLVRGWRAVRAWLGGTVGGVRRIA